MIAILIALMLIATFTVVLGMNALVAFQTAALLFSLEIRRLNFSHLRILLFG
jgi:hypothetical protein